MNQRFVNEGFFLKGAIFAKLPQRGFKNQALHPH